MLGRGGMVVLPTDTVYGVAVLATTPDAVDRLAAAKDRPSSQAVAVLVADAEQADELAELPALRSLVSRVWPGPVTLIVPRRPTARGLRLGGDPDAIGLRCPGHQLVRCLAARAGPLAVTSANRHGEPTPTTARAAADGLAEPVDLVLGVGRCEGTASAVIDLTREPWTVLRPGPFDEATVLALLVTR